MRALFIGGTVDNSELDLEGDQPPRNYPENGGSGQPRYRLHHVGLRDGKQGDVAYAVYAAPEMRDEEIERVAGERDYPRRFQAQPSPPF